MPSYWAQATPAGGPVGAPRRTSSEASFWKARCCTMGGSVGDRVKKTPTVPPEQLALEREMREAWDDYIVKGDAYWAAVKAAQDE